MKPNCNAGPPVRLGELLLLLSAKQSQLKDERVEPSRSEAAQLLLLLLTLFAQLVSYAQ